MRLTDKKKVKDPEAQKKALARKKAREDKKKPVKQSMKDKLIDVIPKLCLYIQAYTLTMVYKRSHIDASGGKTHDPANT